MLCYAVCGVQAVRLFGLFLSKEFAFESLVFYEAVNRYRSMVQSIYREVGSGGGGH